MCLRNTSFCSNEEALLFNFGSDCVAFSEKCPFGGMWMRGLRLDYTINSFCFLLLCHANIFISAIIITLPPHSLSPPLLLFLTHSLFLFYLLSQSYLQSFEMMKTTIYFWEKKNEKSCLEFPALVFITRWSLATRSEMYKSNPSSRHFPAPASMCRKKKKKSLAKGC